MFTFAVYLERADSTSWLSEANPLLPTSLACRVQHTSQQPDKLEAAEGLWWHLQPLLPCVRASTVWLQWSQQKLVEHKRRNLQLSTLIKDTKKSHSTLGAPLQICSPEWVHEKEGDYYKQATAMATKQLFFGDPLCSSWAWQKGSIPSAPSWPSCLCHWEPVECYLNIVYFINFLLPSIDE